jgi:anti-anti-sigma factor
MPESPATAAEKRSNIVVVRVLADRIDEGNLAAVRAETAAAGAESPQATVALDMGNVEFVPSVSLGGLIQLSQLFKGRHQRLVLVNLQPSVRETMVLTRLDRLFEIQSDLSGLLRGA